MAFNPYWKPPVEEDKAAWNINQQRADFVALLLWRATSSMIKFDYSGQFYNLSGVREFIDADCSLDETKKLDVLETEIRTYSVLWSSSIVNPNTKKNSEEFKKLNSDFAGTVREYSRYIQMLLKKQGYYTKKKDERYIGGSK